MADDDKPKLRGEGNGGIPLTDLLQEVLQRVLPPEGAPSFAGIRALTGLEEKLRAIAVPVDFQGIEFRIFAGDRVCSSGIEGTSGAGQVNLIRLFNQQNTKLLYINDFIVLSSASAGPVRVRQRVVKDGAANGGAFEPQRRDSRISGDSMGSIPISQTDGGAAAPANAPHLAILGSGQPSLVVPFQFVLHPGGHADFFTVEQAVSLGVAMVGRVRRILTTETPA